MLTEPTQHMFEKLAERRKRGNLRRLWPMAWKHDFCSNDYLGYARAEDLLNAVRVRSAASSRIGATGARLISGNCELYEALEARIAEIWGFPKALIFATGFALNSSLLPAVAGKSDAIIMDELAHASLKQGLRLSAARGFFFRHNDLEHLRSRLLGVRKRFSDVFVVVESLYSMDGDIAPLAEICSLCAEFDCRLIVDEAHSAGTLGRRGLGLVLDAGLQAQVFAMTITFGKAFGSSGAALLAGKETISFAQNFCQAWIYSTALPSFCLLAIDEALSLFLRDKARLERLQGNWRKFAKAMPGLAGSDSPIFAVPCASVADLQRQSLELRRAGYGVVPILSPTVRRGSERLRICIHAFNTELEIANLAEMLGTFPGNRQSP